MGDDYCTCQGGCHQHLHEIIETDHESSIDTTIKGDEYPTLPRLELAGRMDGFQSPEFCTG